MDTNLKPNSPPVLLAVGSLILLALGGPIFWLGARAANMPDRDANITSLWVGGAIFAVAYLLFVLAIFSTFVTFYLRARRANN